MFQIINQGNLLSNKNAVLPFKLLIHNKMRDDCLLEKKNNQKRQKPNRVKSKENGSWEKRNQGGRTISEWLTSLMRLMKRVPKRHGLWRLHCSELTVICGNCWTATDTTWTASYISAASVWNQRHNTALSTKHVRQASRERREQRTSAAPSAKGEKWPSSLCSTVKCTLVVKSYMSYIRVFRQSQLLSF